MPSKPTKGKAPTAQTVGASSAQNQPIKERTEPLNLSPENDASLIAFEGHWEEVSRKQFPDLTGTDDGYVIAVEAVGHGVIVGGSRDPAYYMLTLGKRYKSRGVTFGTALVSAPVYESTAQARAIVYHLAGQRSDYAGLLPLTLVQVKAAIEKYFSVRRTP